MKIAARWLWSKTEEDPAKYLDDIYRYARARLGSHEDAVDVAIEVVQSLPCPCRRHNLLVYMIGMARRKVAGRLRNAREIPGILETDLVVTFDRASDETLLVDVVLAKLTDDQREALILKYVIGMSAEEVGAALNKNSEAIDSLLQRGRAAFAREWNALSSEEITR